jgi:hypothetical protein
MSLCDDYQRYYLLDFNAKYFGKTATFRINGGYMFNVGKKANHCPSDAI